MSTLNVGAIDFTTGVAIKSQAVNPQTGTTYTFVATDAGTLVSASNASAVTFTIPPQSSVTWGANAVLKVVNYGAGALTVNGGAGVTVTNTAATLAQFESAAAIRTAENAWTLVPFSGGVGNADFSDAATGTYTGFKYITFTGSSTLNVTKAGFADVVILAGGAGGGYWAGGGGGAGGLFGGGAVSIYLPVALMTVTIGAGGAGGIGVDEFGLTGTGSRLDNFLAAGGGSGASIARYPGGGGSGGGSGRDFIAGGVGMVSQGNAGGVGSASNYYGGGGGGAGAVGGAAVSTTAGAGGAGVNVTIAGTTPSGAYVAGNYALGGGGGGGGTGGTAGTASFGGGAGSNSGAAGSAALANKGGGGGGGGSGNGGNGSSGIVIVRVAA